MKVIRVENQQQNFGMSFKIDPCAEKILKKRLKEEDLAKFQELISSQKNNKNVDIFLCPPEFSFFHDRKLGAMYDYLTSCNVDRMDEAALNYFVKKLIRCLKILNQPKM